MKRRERGHLLDAFGPWMLLEVLVLQRLRRGASSPRVVRQQPVQQVHAFLTEPVEIGLEVVVRLRLRGAYAVAAVLGQGIEPRPDLFVWRAEQLVHHVQRLCLLFTRE